MLNQMTPQRERELRDRLSEFVDAIAAEPEWGAVVSVMLAERLGIERPLGKAATNLPSLAAAVSCVQHAESQLAEAIRLLVEHAKHPHCVVQIEAVG